MYVFGGYVNGVKSNDVYKYDRSNQRWIRLDVNQVKPVKKKKKKNNKVFASKDN